MSNWREGQKVNQGKYVIEAFLGEGGYGVTYRASDTSTGEPFALKTLNSQHQNRDDFSELQQRFINEAIALASCHHPHIVRVYPQMFQEGKLWCMVMEYVAGQGLQDYIAVRGKLSEADAIAVIERLGDALTCVHDRDLLHRDVKPSNVLLRNDDVREPVLIDFGLARKFDIERARTMTNAVTESFAPLEQYERRGNFGPWTDVYALAATLYVLLAAKLPLPSQFRQETPEAFLPPQHYNRDISDRVNAAILAGMAVEVKDRPQSVVEWLALLKPTRSREGEERERSTAPPLEIIPAVRAALPAFSFEVPTVDARGQVVRREVGKANYLREVLKVKRILRKDLVVPLDMVAIPEGSFLMGLPEGESARENADPQHRVRIRAFFLGKYLVTQAQWQAVAEMPKVKRELDPDPARFKGSERPVEQVSWYDAVEFCDRLSRYSDRRYRLPSEAEWEYACRAGTTTPFHFGETISSDLANYDSSHTYASESPGKHRQQTTPAGSFPPNAFGLYDMHGNLWEWVADRYYERYRGTPNSGSAGLEDERENSASSFGLRGGSWYYPPRFCRSAIRGKLNPNDRSLDVGFRVALAAEAIAN